MKNNKLFIGLVSIVAPFVAGAIGNSATIPNINSWYAYLVKPSFSPPNWVFGPVWTVLYLLMGVSLYLVWTARANAKTRKNKTFAYQLFGLQLALNSLWSIVFFGLHSPWAAVVVIVGLALAITVTMKAFWPISRAAVYLLVPYFVWVLFATALNTAVAVLN